MKLTIFAASVVVCNAADETPNNTTLLRQFNQLNKMFYSQVTNSQWDFSTLDKMIQNYGCHCFPDDSNQMIGYGMALDPIDEVCKGLQSCRACIDIEFPFTDFDTQQGKYRYTMSPDNEIVCDGRNSPEQMALCECDKQFGIKLASIWEDSAYDFSLWYSRSNRREREANGLPVFDRATECVTSPGPAKDTCCGDSFPHKIPFHAGSKSCCDNDMNAPKAYDSTTSECCSDGSVRFLGNCP